MVMRNDGAPANAIAHSLTLDSYYPAIGAPVVFSTNGLTQFSFNARSAFIQMRWGSWSNALELR